MLPFEYERPESLQQTLSILEKRAAGARLLAGGTDLMVGLRHGTVRPSVVVDLKRIEDLPPAVTRANGYVTIGATAVLSSLVDNGDIGTYFPALIEAVQTVGSIQIRNRATLVGNVCNASPAADTVPALLVYGALVHLTGRSGTRHLPLDEFILGPRRTALEPGELVTSLSLPTPERPAGVAFARMTRRRGVDLATINLCCSIDSAGVVSFAYGAVGPRPFLVTDGTGALADPGLPEGAQEALLSELVGYAAPITDLRASRE